MVVGSLVGAGRYSAGICHCAFLYIFYCFWYTLFTFFKNLKEPDIDNRDRISNDTSKKPCMFFLTWATMNGVTL